jgi:two-component system LytT family response regulator
MTNAIVVDDEWYNLKEISELVQNTDFLHVTGRYQNPLLVLEELDQTSPDVAFIDIEMPEIDGITLAEKLLERKPSTIIVFITSWDQYAVKAFDLNALDYILKPIKLERFSRMIEKIRGEVSQKNILQSPLLKIRCFDKLETTLGGVPVKWERAKAEELFAFLLMNHGHFMHKELIIENLWPNYVPEKALPILQTAICKIRKVFSRVPNNVKIEYQGNQYCLTIKNAQCDLFDMENALSNDASPPLSILEKLYDQFGEGFLAQQGYLWSLEKDEQLRKKLLSLNAKANNKLKHTTL